MPALSSVLKNVSVNSLFMQKKIIKCHPMLGPDNLGSEENTKGGKSLPRFVLEVHWKPTSQMNANCVLY